MNTTTITRKQLQDLHAGLLQGHPSPFAHEEYAKALDLYERQKPRREATNALYQKGWRQSFPAWIWAHRDYGTETFTYEEALFLADIPFPEDLPPGKTQLELAQETLREAQAVLAEVKTLVAKLTSKGDGLE